MRKAVAIFVLLAVLLGIAAPALWAAQVSGDVHACCRRDGAHQCSQHSSKQGPGFRAESLTCPYRVATTPGAARLASLAAIRIALNAPSTLPLRVSAASSAKIAHHHGSAVLLRGPPLS